MAILERIDAIGFRWTPATAPRAKARDDEYPGRHRQGGGRRLSLTALFYVAVHTQYVPRHARAIAQRARHVPRHSRLG